MRIGIIVDGQAEYRSLKSMFLKIDTGATLLGPLYSDLQPYGNEKKIVRAALPAIKVLAGKRAARVLVVLDHEGRGECPPRWREKLEAAFEIPCKSAGIADVKVVLKVRKFENWLISDPLAIRGMPGRFQLSGVIERQIVPNNADRVDALSILKRAAQGHDYHKTRDAVALMARFDPYTGAANSRSLRRFLALLGSPRYAGQSRVPA